jgi:predicted acylesterase/phospholipase RssA
MNSAPIEDILNEEISPLERSRKLRLGDNPKRPPAGDSLVGLAFSGGGIRSATFNLGVLQALAKSRLLRTFDYISTVSGGGYIGSWLMAWMHHQNIGIKKIEEHLSEHPNSPSQVVERPEVRFLRNYSNYLTPRKGLLGADFWAFAGTYLRNTFLNQMILVLLLLSLLMLPRAIVTVFHFLEIAENSLQSHDLGVFQELLYAQDLAVLIGLVLGLLAVTFIGRNLVALVPEKDKTYPWFTKQSGIQAVIVAPLFLAAALVTYGLGHFLTDYQILDHPFSRLVLLGVFLYFAPWAVALLARRAFWKESGTTETGLPKDWLFLGTAAVTGAVVSFLFLPYAHLLITTSQIAGQEARAATNWHVMTFGTPAFTLIMLLAGALHIGLMGRQMTDAHREWWARLGGWLAIYSVCWLFLFLIALYSPFVIARILSLYHGPAFTVTGIFAWIASTCYGVLFGKSAATAGLLPNAPLRKKLLVYLARLTPYVFILGLLIALSLLDTKIAHALAGINGSIFSLPKDPAFYPWKVPAMCVFMLGVALIISWRVDVNEFSIHYLYRNRLVRCYLGASVNDRKEQPFTGFSVEDDVPLALLQIPTDAKDGIDDRPLPILNTTLNVVRGKELALQTRKARSFPFTPLSVGFTRPIPCVTESESIFGRTESLGADRPNSKNGVRLGTAMAISGAAVSPNMGFYSATDLSFLMTLFDVRLGWWLANPKDTIQRWRMGSPNLGFYWLLRELLGATSDDSQYVYLSDGGHFENLAIYELVRRRCKLIVACDASCDSAYGCSDLHNAMERCRVDFGVEIEITAGEVGKVTPAGVPPRAAAHYAIGLIHYSPGSPEKDGILIYVKPTLQASDAADLLGYSSTNTSFPHDSTADQWFDESHFENYRALGEAAGRATIDTFRAEVERLLAFPK